MERMIQTHFADNELRYMEQDTLVFKACSHDGLSPGYPMYICAPESCCAHVEPNRRVKITAYMILKSAMKKPSTERSILLSPWG